jgi:hypothetical protein
MLVVHKMLKLRFGWFFVLINLHMFYLIVLYGNIHNLIILLSFYPLGSLFCTAIKPFYVVIPVLFYFTKNKMIRKIGILWLVITAFILIIFYPSKEVMAYVLKHNDLVNRSLLLSMNIYYVMAQIKFIQKGEKNMSILKKIIRWYDTIGLSTEPCSGRYQDNIPISERMQ